MSSNPPLKSSSTSNISETSTSTKDEDYEDETFEEEEETFQGLSLSTLERFSSSHMKTFPNKTFTAPQIREIERQNAILMNKILTYTRKPVKPKVTLPNRYHVTSSAINRKKNQKKIEWENQILLKKIQTVKPSIKIRN